MTEQLTSLLARHVAKITYHDLPPEVIEQTKRLILDTIGCMLGGLSIEKGKLAVKFAKYLAGPPEATIVGDGQMGSAPAVAFANGELANALDFDDYFAYTHLANFVVSSALASAERMKTSGKDLIAAIAVGYDISARLCIAFPGWTKIEGEPPNTRILPSKRTSESFQALGATVTASKLLNLREDGIASALGIAGYNAPVSSMGKFTMSTSLPMTKYFSGGWTSLVGVSAAILAESGYTGDKSVLDGEYGFHRMVGVDSIRQDLLTKELGEKWWIMDACFKPYPCCACEHRPLDAFYSLVRQNKILPGEIEKIVVRVPKSWIFEIAKLEARDALSFQFSIPYIFAVAAAGHPPGIEWQSDALNDPIVKSLAKKVVIEEEPRASQAFYEQLAEGQVLSTPPRVPCSVMIMARGRAFEATKEYAKGVPWKDDLRLTDQELVEKFQGLASWVIGEGSAALASKMIFNMENSTHIEEITRHLKPGN